MAKLESNLKNMVLSLLFISMAMAAALGYVYSLTKGPIAEVDLKKELAALKQVLPPFDNDPASEKKEIGGVVLYPAKKGGNLVGVAVKTYTEKGFSGRFDLMVGFLPDGSINEIAVIKQNETPGLGTKMSEPKFKDQFKGKNPDKFKMYVKKDMGEVEAITASTITSRAFCDAVQRGFDKFKESFLNASTETAKPNTLQTKPDTIKTQDVNNQKGGQK